MRLGAIAAIVALTSGCVSKQKAPELSGPSELGLSLAVTASPQILPRDGASTSAISVKAFDANGQPKSGQRLMLSASAGTLSVSEVNTTATGLAPVVIYTAPGLNVGISNVTITVTPVESGDLYNSNSRSILIAVVGPDVPVASFTPPAGAAVMDTVTFNASASTLGGVACGSSCSYTWDFGDGSTGKDLVVQHQYSNSGVFNATLTVTAASGTSNSVTKPVVINPPALTTPDFTFGPCLSLVAKCVTFTDVSFPANGVTIVSRLWDFGDSTTPVSTPDPTIDHTFPANPNPVTYNVKLRLTDNFGRVSTTIKPVAVP